MPYGSWINDLPTAFFMVVHIAAFALGAGFAWLAFKRELTLLGTAFTMEKAFYRDRIASHGVEVIVPGEEDRQAVHRAIFDELAVGVSSESTRARFRSIIDSLVAEGAEGIILGCTEIELLVMQADSPVPVFPTAKLHIEAAVDLALS